MGVLSLRCLFDLCLVLLVCGCLLFVSFSVAVCLLLLAVVCWLLVVVCCLLLVVCCLLFVACIDSLFVTCG